MSTLPTEKRPRGRPRKPPGRPLKEVNMDIVRALATFGASITKIAEYINMDDAACLRRFGPLIREIREAEGIIVNDGVQPLPIDERQVEVLASIGMSPREIAKFCGVSTYTINRRCGAAIKRGEAKKVVNLRKKMLDLALGGSERALLYLIARLDAQDDAHAAKSDGGGEAVGMRPSDPLRLILEAAGKALPGSVAMVKQVGGEEGAAAGFAFQDEDEEPEVVIIPTDGVIDVVPEPEKES